jgi:hypothetical protein
MSQNQDNSNKQPNQQNPSPGQQQQSEPQNKPTAQPVTKIPVQNSLKTIISSINNRYYFYNCRYLRY